MIFKGATKPLKPQNITPRGMPVLHNQIRGDGVERRASKYKKWHHLTSEEICVVMYEVSGKYTQGTQ